MKKELVQRLQLLASAVSVLVVLAIAAVVWFYTRVRASLPQLDGRAVVAGLTASVTVDRDALGVPTLHAPSRVDVARALGFLHAQDRFFQMDVWRRAAAGELSEVFGPRTLEHDRRMRQHGFRALALVTLSHLPPEHRQIVEAYAQGVNAGLAALREKPWEYFVIRATPQSWKPEDTFLVCDAMLIDLQDDTGRYEATLMALRDQLGEAGIAFFGPLLTPNDAALDGSSAPVAPVPGPQLINIRSSGGVAVGDSLPREAARAESQAGSALSSGTSAFHDRVALPAVQRPSAASSFPFPDRDPEAVPGSNAFALAGRHTANGSGLLASDIHLSLRVPNVWYRASFDYAGHKVTGITLPGVPLIIAGSNGHVAWSFTNSYADTGDLIAIDRNGVAPTLYRVPGSDDFARFEKRKETILVHGDKPETVEYDWSIWGPVVGQDDKGRPLAYLWIGHDPDATNLELLGMEDASDVATAVAVAHRTGMPDQNVVIADSAGNIAWTLAGRLPRRIGYDGRLPVTFQYGDRKWDGFVPPDEIPVVTTKPTGNPAEIASKDGRIWSANQRMIGGHALSILGDGGYARPARAAQIRDDIAKLEHAVPRDLLAVQLDDRAVFLDAWHRLLLDILTPKVTAEKSVRAALRGYVEKWEGRASPDAVAYPLARLFRVAVYTRAFTPIFASCQDENPRFAWNQLLLEGAIWTMIKEKPAHLLDPQYASWDALLVAAADDVIRELDRVGVRLPHATWGQRNTAEIRHPFSYTLPWFVRPWLDMPADQLPGDVDMPRAQTPTHGPSERFVVAPGHEDEGIFEMPCGQSGHPLSPYYRAGHEAWVRGDPTPFLPGRTEHTLTLAPH